MKSFFYTHVKDGETTLNLFLFVSSAGSIDDGMNLPSHFSELYDEGLLKDSRSYFPLDR